MELNHFIYLNSYEFYTKYNGSYEIENTIFELFKKFPMLKTLHERKEFKLLYNLVNQLDIEIDYFL